MRRFFHGNIRISPDFRSCAAIESAPQRLQIVALRKRLLHVDANAKHALLRAAVGDLAEEQPVALVDSHRHPGRKRLPENNAQTAPGEVDGAADDRISGRVGQVSDSDVVIDRNARFPPSFHGKLIGGSAPSMNPPDRCKRIQ